MFHSHNVLITILFLTSNNIGVIYTEACIYRMSSNEQWRFLRWKKFNRIFNLLDDMILSSSFNKIFSICSLYICMKSLAWLCFSKLFLYYSVLCILSFHVYLPSLANQDFEAWGKFIYSLMTSIMYQILQKAVRVHMEPPSYFLLACIFLLRITAASKLNHLNLVWKQNLDLLILAINTLGLVSLCL